MKQYITVTQVNNLSLKEKKKLRDWWQPKKGDYFVNEWKVKLFYGEGTGFEDETAVPDKIYFKDSEGEGKGKDLPLLSIGQMIEYLGDDYIDIFINIDFYDLILAKEVCNALWEAVKANLKEKDRKKKIDEALKNSTTTKFAGEALTLENLSKTIGLLKKELYIFNRQ